MTPPATRDRTPPDANVTARSHNLRNDQLYSCFPGKSRLGGPAHRRKTPEPCIVAVALLLSDLFHRSLDRLRGAMRSSRHALKVRFIIARGPRRIRQNSRSTRLISGDAAARLANESGPTRESSRHGSLLSVIGCSTCSNQHPCQRSFSRSFSDETAVARTPRDTTAGLHDQKLLKGSSGRSPPRAPDHVRYRVAEPCVP